MTRKILSVLITVVCAMCVFCSTVSVFAETTDFEQGDFNEETTEKKENITTTKDNSFIPDDLKPTKAPTTTEKVTVKKPDKTTTTTKKNDDKRDEESTTRTKTTATEVVATTKDDGLPEGSFYVYVEKNNGEPRLKRVMTEPGIVPEPSIPVRVGYDFVGWYADPEFTTEWSFLTGVAKEGTVIYAKWTSNGSLTEYKIKVNKIVGGKVSVNPSTATANEHIVITVEPDQGKRLVAGSITVNGVPTDVLSFIMPAGNVVINASFEDVPDEAVEPEDKSIVPFVIGGIALVVAVFVVAVIIRRRQMYEFSDDEIDENGTIIDNDDGDWYDESIVVEDGFKNGERVIGNYEPDVEDVDIEDFE